MNSIAFDAGPSSEGLASVDDDPYPERRALVARGPLSAVWTWMRRLVQRPPEPPAAGAPNPPPAISRKQSRLIKNVLRLSERRVSDAMIPRADIIGVEEGADLGEVLAAFRQSRLSRLMVFRETLDEPTGFIHVKDLMLAYGFDAPTPDQPFNLRRHLRRVLFVPPSLKAATLLERMQADRIHMALVIDEYGGVDGLVTIEDLIEEVVGDIADEHEEAPSQGWRRLPDGAYECDARADLEDFEAEVGVKLAPEDADEEEIDTLGGVVFFLCAGRVPQPGEVVRHPDGHEFAIIDADPRRIKRLRLKLADSESQAA